jgi:polysaccharide export outer membrane protein
MSQKTVTAFALLVVAGFAGCAATSDARGQEAVAYPTWTEADAETRLFPGDEVDVTVLSAPELSRKVRVGPDGRIPLAMVEPVMAADKTPRELKAAITTAYAAILKDPMIDVTAAFGPRQVFIGGEVQRPGVYDIPGQADALQAVLMAGGFTTAGRRKEVVLLRRAPGGDQYAMTMDLDPRRIRAGVADAPPLQRFDVIFVPRTPVAKVGLFVQHYVRDAIPINFALAYDFARFND